jgi:hypothetical protein
VNAHTHKSCCPECGKFLTRPRVKIEPTTLTDEEFNRFTAGVSVKYGAQTKCRFCKKVRETEMEIKTT